MTPYTSSYNPTLYTLMCIGLLLLLSPFSANAAAPRPSCAIVATTTTGVADVGENGTLYFKKGTPVALTWEASNATRMTNSNGKTIPRTGTATTSPSHKTKVVYTVINAGRHTTCSATLIPVTATFTSRDTAAATEKVTLTGTVAGERSVRVLVQKAGDSHTVYRSSIVKLKKNAWRVSLPKKLPRGTYTVSLIGSHATEQNIIATSTLRVGTATSQSSSATLAVGSIPLLAGGVTRMGTVVPVSYLQVTNIGTQSVDLTGFWLTERGTLPASLITGLTVVNDIGDSRGSVGGTDAASPFVDDRAFIPVTNTTFAPGQMRLFTIKAILSSTASNAVGTEMKIDVASVESDGSVHGPFPIRGTTWVIGR